MKTKSHWVIPGDKLPDQGELKLADGKNSFEPAMVGAYYGSSLEYNIVVTPQYLNGQDRKCPMEDKLHRIFKPKRPYGTFGSLVKDQNMSEYTFEAGRAIIELIDEDEITQVADSIERAAYGAAAIMSDLTYTDTSGHKCSYSDAMKEIESYREHNHAIQAKIDAAVKDAGFAKEFRNGRFVSRPYPDYLKDKVTSLAKEKKAFTGLNLKVQIVGKHTIALEENYYKSSISNEELLQLAEKCNYKTSKSKSYKQGTIRLGTMVIPIQTEAQLKTIKKSLGNFWADYVHSSWGQRIKDSCIPLKRETYDSEPS